MSLAENIKNRRTAKGFSQEELAKKIGVAQKQISQYESGQRRPDCFNIVYLAKALDTTAEQLIDGQTAERTDENYVNATEVAI